MERFDDGNPQADQLTESVREALGPEYEDLADRLTPAIRTVAEKIADQATQPLREHQERILADAAMRESDATLAAFAETHPDVHDHEQKMLELARQVQPAMDERGQPVMTEDEYLEVLYRLATRDGDGDSQGDTSHTSRTAGPSSKCLTFDEAAALAMKQLGK